MALRKYNLYVRSALVVKAVGLLAHPAAAVTFETMNGAPVQMQPYADEPGAPAVTIPLGTAQPFAGASASAGAGSGGTTGGTEALNIMLATPWGSDASAAAMAVGINPSVLAATCVVESGCQNVSGSGTVSGAFQMTNATYRQDMNRVVAQNPDLASVVDTSLAGKMNPATKLMQPRRISRTPLRHCNPPESRTPRSPMLELISSGGQEPGHQSH